MRRSLFVALLFTVVAGPSCVDVARSRAETDVTIGQSSTDAMDVSVEDGLACVRAVSDGVLELRAQAPTLRVRVTRKTAGDTFHLRLRNALADATLEARDVESGAALAALGEPFGDAEPNDPTDKAWRVSLPASGARVIELRVHAPDEADESPYRFAVLADVQEAVVSVRDVYARMRDDRALRFVLFSGDLTQRGSREELVEFEERERELPIPLYATLGNHELGSGRVYFQEMFGRASFHFDFRGVAFSLLDSGSATIDPLVYDWLSGWLGAAQDRVHVVSTHIPPFDPVGFRSGAFASRAEAAKLVAMLAAGHVDLSVFGHVHSYYAFSNAGVPAYISGGGGAIPERMDGIGRHYLVVEVDPRVGVRTVGVTRVD